MPDSLPTVEQCGLTFARLSVNERAVILRAAKLQHKTDNADSLKLAGADSDRTTVQLCVIDKEKWGYGRFLELIDSMDGQDAIITRSLLKASPTANVDDLKPLVTLTFEETVKLCCELTGTPFQAAVVVPKNMVQVGVFNGEPVYKAVDGKPPEGERPAAYGDAPKEGDEADPTTAPTPKRGYGS